jgi:hypothetical protein
MKPRTTIERALPLASTEGLSPNDMMYDNEPILASTGPNPVSTAIPDPHPTPFSAAC